MTDQRTEQSLEARARRAAKRAGYLAHKSRWRAGTIDNHGGFMIVDPRTNFVMASSRFDLTPEDVIAWCEG
jgi:hypothetical protein